MQWDRRTLLRQSALAASGFTMGRRLLAQVSPQGAESGNSLVERMTWLNEPASSKGSGGKLFVHSRAKTDFWRKTFYGYITDNGHFFRFSASGDFVFQARVNGEYAALYDQAGLMKRLDAENWMKCGTEFFDGQRHASVVFYTRLLGLVHDDRLIKDCARMLACRSQKRLRRDPLFSGRHQFHIRAPGLFPARRESGCGHHVRRPGGPGLRRHLRQSQARTRLAQRAPNFTPKSISSIGSSSGGLVLTRLSCGGGTGCHNQCIRKKNRYATAREAAGRSSSRNARMTASSTSVAYQGDRMTSKAPFVTASK